MNNITNLEILKQHVTKKMIECLREDGATPQQVNEIISSDTAVDEINYLLHEMQVNEAVDGMDPNDIEKLVERYSGDISNAVIAIVNDLEQG